MRCLLRGAVYYLLSERWWIISAKSINGWKRISSGSFSRRRCAWAGYLLVGPVVFPAALRLAGLLVAGPTVWVARTRHLCRPRECLQGPDAKKDRTCVRALISNMAVRGGLTRFARPCGAARLLRARSVQLAAPVVEPRSGVLIPPNGEYKRKKPVLSYELSSRIWR